MYETLAIDIFDNAADERHQIMKQKRAKRRERMIAQKTERRINR